MIFQENIMDRKDSMNVVLITGIFGILSFLFLVVNTTLYFVYPGTPPVWNVLLRTLVGSIMLSLLLVFFIGFRKIIKSVDKKYDWIADLIFNSACMFLTISFVAKSLEAGAVFNPEGIAVDATQDGILAQGNYLLYGSIARLLTSVFMMAIGYATFKVRIFPVWTSILALIISITNIVFIPSMFFGTDARQFYSAIGWGNSALTAGLFSYWVFIVSVMLVKNRTKILN
jgi:hypothetical protein